MAAATILVTGGDARYFPLMRGCLASVLAQPQATGMALGVLDCGLDADARLWLAERGARVVEPGYDVVFGAGLQVAPAFRAMTARPWLRRYFPGFDTYLWLDADVWVQDGAALSLLVDAARLGDIAIVPEMHRSYSNFRDTRDDFEAANGRAYAEAYGAQAAARLIRRPLNNAGVFAMRQDSAAWDIWGSALADAAQRSANMVDQIALNAAIHDGRIREVRLPATCNWIAHLAMPAVDAESGKLVEPDPPFEPIGILHMTLGTKWADAVELAVAGGATSGRVRRSLGYQG